MPGPVTFDIVEQVVRPAAVNDAQKSQIRLIEDTFIRAIQEVISTVPNCADRSDAVRDMRKAKMMCVEAIAKGGLV